MFTITKEQVSKDKEWANDRTYRLIKEYVDMSKYTRPSPKQIKRVQVSVVYNEILQGWVQGDFTDQEYINYLTAKGYLNLIDKIRSL